MSRFFDDAFHLFLIMKAGIIHHDDAGRMQLRQQHFLKPLIDGFGVAASSEQHGREPFFSALRHDKVGGFAIIAADQAKDFLPNGRPTVWPVALRPEATLIEIHDILRTVFLHRLTQVLQKPHSFVVIYLRISRRFFY